MFLKSNILVFVFICAYALFPEQYLHGILSSYISSISYMPSYCYKQESPLIFNVEDYIKAEMGMIIHNGDEILTIEPTTDVNLERSNDLYISRYSVNDDSGFVKIDGPLSMCKQEFTNMYQSVQVRTPRESPPLVTLSDYPMLIRILPATTELRHVKVITDDDQSDQLLLVSSYEPYSEYRHSRHLEIRIIRIGRSSGELAVVAVWPDARDYIAVNDVSVIEYTNSLIRIWVECTTAGGRGYSRWGYILRVEFE